MIKKKQQYSLVFIAWTIAACGSADRSSSTQSESPIPTHSLTVINEDTILEEFLRSAAEHEVEVPQDRLSTLSIAIRDVPAIEDTGVAIGICRFESNEVEILAPNRWPSQSPSYLRMLRTGMHELGHCLLGLQHDDSQLNGFDHRYRIMGSRESLLNHQLKPQIWDDLIATFFEYARRVSGASSIRSLAYGLSETHDASCQGF